jgi:hypothetical protein
MVMRSALQRLEAARFAASVPGGNLTWLART